MRIEKLLFISSVMLLLTACGNDMFDKFELTPLGGNIVTDQSWKPVECTIDKVRFKSFRINAMTNDNLMADLVFSAKQNDVCSAVVEHYRLDSMCLVPTWDCVAAKVTVDGVDQVPGETPNDFSSPVTYRLYASDGQYKEYTFSITQGDYTGFQVVSIVSSRSITNKSVWASSILKLSGQQSGYSDVIYPSQAKYRGNNSLQNLKKSYTVKFDNKSSFMGMNRHTRWCFLANAADRTMLRNRVAFEISSRTGLPWTPDSRYCELFVNSKYCGLYLIAEQIRIGKNRVNITEMCSTDTAGENLTGGYLLECDRYVDNISFNTAVRHLPINIKSPNEDVINDMQIDYIEDYFKKIEQLLYRADVPDPAYRELIDLESFADVWIVLELTNCTDARLPGSIWYYKDRNGKLFAGPVWDFDLAAFNPSNSFLLYDYEITDFTSNDNSLWYSRLFLDPVFKSMVKRRWQTYYPSFASIPEYIDSQAEMIENSMVVNDKAWPGRVTGNPDASMSWDESVEELKKNYSSRLKMLNDSISSW